MHEEIVALERATDAAKAALAREAEAGMLVARAQFDLSRADEALTKARADVHLFQPYAVQQTAAGGLTIARTAQAQAALIRHERDFRRKGLVVALLLMLGLLRFFYRWVVHPIRDLEMGVGLVAKGDFDHRIDIQSGDEIQDLAQAFNDMSSRLRDMYRNIAGFDIAHSHSVFLWPTTAAARAARSAGSPALR
jgi:methyl-accepting chemotaxis protein